MKDKKEWTRGPAGRALSRSPITVLRASPAAKGGREIFNVATLERIAEQMAGASGERPLVGRLKYLRRMNFPTQVIKGRGKKAVLGLDDVMQILFALELIHAGTSPTRAMRIMRTDWTIVKKAIAYGWSRANDIGNPERPHKSLVFAPSVLTELGGDDRADEPLHEVVGVHTFEDLAQMEDRGDAPIRMLIISTHAFALALRGLEEVVLGVPTKNFVEEMHMFCAEAFGSTKPLKWNV